MQYTRTETGRTQTRSIEAAVYELAGDYNIEVYHMRNDGSGEVDVAIWIPLKKVD